MYILIITKFLILTSYFFYIIHHIYLGISCNKIIKIIIIILIQNSETVKLLHIIIYSISDFTSINYLDLLMKKR